MHRYEDLIQLFDQCFLTSYNTRLVRGLDEPIYLPSGEGRVHHELHFAHGFFRSALHEISHWLIAGEKRRLMIDFGYWYEPDGRSSEQQALFEKVEVKPQALEWILTKATGHNFRVSADNLNGESLDTQAFKQAIIAQVHSYCQNGLSLRAKQFRKALCQFYQTPLVLKAEDFNFAEL